VKESHTDRKEVIDKGMIRRRRRQRNREGDFSSLSAFFHDKSKEIILFNTS